MSRLQVTWLRHSTVLLDTPGGKRVLIDPWLTSNPATPAAFKDVAALARLDVLLITHGHFDHMADAVAVAKAYKPQVVAIFEIAEWLGAHGVENLQPMNLGGTIEVGGHKVTMTNAHHSSGISDADGKIVYGGDPAGYVVEFENGRRIYHAGDTCVFGDMALIRELYSPEVVFLPIGDRFTMGPREAAKAVELLQPHKVLPLHYGTFEALTGTPDALRPLLAESVQLLVPAAGEPVEL